MARVAAIGTEVEVDHHVAPLRSGVPIECLDPEIAATELSPGDLAIFYSEHFERFRRCCTTLKQRGVATLYLVDGILEWRNAWENRVDEPACPWTMRPVLSHKVACIGNSQARVLAAWGNRSKIEVTGIPRLDKLKSKTASPPVAGEFRLLVCTAKFPGFTPRQTEITLRSIRELQKFLESKKTICGRTVNVVWRLAPQIAEQIDVPNSLGDLEGNEIAHQIQNVDAVITTASTVMLEAMLLKRPVGLLDYHNTPHYVPAVWNVSAGCQFESVVGELANPSAAKMDWQHQLLGDALQVSQPASDRCVQLIEAMLEISAACVAENRSLGFSESMLQPVAVSDGTFDQQSLFPNHADFKSTDLVEMQAELAHCRREIQHLETVITGLRGELGQAHEIFEQIQKHPLAGPIVRLRQRVMELTQRWKGNYPPVDPPAETVTTAGGDQCNRQ